MTHIEGTEQSLPSSRKAHEADGLEAGSQGLECLRLRERYHKSSIFNFQFRVRRCIKEEISIEAVVTGRPFAFMGNVRNDIYITNLPDGCCVEVPAFADSTGVHPTKK